MFYPKRMTILGQPVNVKLLDRPLYQMHACPKCVTPQSYKSFMFPVAPGTSKACPACGCEHTQPINNSIVLGQFVIEDNTIKTWNSSAHQEVCKTSFVHETIEAINCIADLQLNHTQITALAAALYQAFSSGKVNFAV